MKLNGFEMKLKINKLLKLPYIMMRLEQAIIVENSINETLKLPLEHCDECGE